MSIPRHRSFAPVPASEITPRAVYQQRRLLLARMAGGAAGVAMAAWAARAQAPASLRSCPLCAAASLAP